MGEEGGEGEGGKCRGEWREFSMPEIAAGAAAAVWCLWRSHILCFSVRRTHPFRGSGGWTHTQMG